MRDIPSLSAEMASRATSLAAKARNARREAPGTVPPSASIAPAKVADGVATLRIYDYIDGEGGYWGISAEEVAGALENIEEPIDRIDLRINSGGGAVWDGLAILNQLRSRPEPVRAIVDGIAASAASFIAVACDEVVMMPNARMMIHDALGICVGQAVDMREYADFLDDSSQNIAELYAAKAGGTADEWRATMTAKGLTGQWYSSQEAVDAGLADSVWETPAQPQDRAPRETPTSADDTAQDREQGDDIERRHMATRNALAASKHGLPTTA
ncbi:MAG: Clp protease ClpP [Streptomycetaceae bacterium]|nr:Clp protease ClpP [Streptomycetaceae bacterium]